LASPSINTWTSGTYGGIIEVAGNPEPTGIKFFCKDPAGLAYRIQQLKGQFHDPKGGPAGGLEFGAGVSVRGTFSKFGSK